MGAGQIGGLATLIDIDFENPAHFLGEKAEITEGQFIVYYLSHALLFCVGALIEAHVVLTPALCVYGERHKFQVFGGTHKFLESLGVAREVQHMCMHKGYNHSTRFRGKCSTDNIALLVLKQQFSFNDREPGSEFIVNRLRYGSPGPGSVTNTPTQCSYFGWGSRRNGYLMPLLITLRRMDVKILPPEKCIDVFNYKGAYLCIHAPQCKTNKYGALCPDDVGSVITCHGFAMGMMVSRLVDRPCGVGFLDLTKYNKFLTCGVDDSRDVIDHDDNMSITIPDKNTNPPFTPITIPHNRKDA